MRIYNCFPFFNELDLLEIRLAELDGLVDRFVIVESAQTFSGRPKPLYLKENWSRFARYGARIQRVEIEAFPPGLSDWEQEFYQFDQTLAQLADVEPDDLILATDADEIPSAETLRRIREAPPAPGEVICLGLRWFWYYLNLEHRDAWVRGAPRVARCRDVPSIRALRMVRGPAPSPMRDLVRGLKASWYMRRPVRRRFIANAGWHFAWLGGAEAVALKAKAIPQHSGQSPAMRDPDIAARAIAAAARGDGDFALRTLGPDFPRLLREAPERFAQHILTPNLPAPG